MALGYNETLRDNQLDEITALAGTSALLSVYDGSRPATGGAATTLLAQLTCDVTAFAGAAASGVLTLEAISDDTSADATGTATWFRITSSGATHVMDGDVSTSGADLNFDSVSFVAGGTVSVSSFTITAGNA
jgi:hypothetical protein